MSHEIAPEASGFPQTFEILEMIFMHLPGELNHLREVCQWFSHVITNSISLMKKRQLQWNHSSEKYFRSTGHKFCNIQFSRIRRENVPDLLQFVHQHHLILSKIQYDHEKSVLTAEEFHKIILLVAGTIEEFKMFSPLQSNAVYPRRVLPKLKSLALNHESGNFLDYTGTDSKVFMPKLSKFEYIENFEPGEPGDATRMLEFLRSIESLEVLTIQKSLARRLLTESRVEPFRFQLKQLTLKMYDLKFVSEDIDGDNMLEFTTPDLVGFLASQQNSLTHLSIENAAIHVSDYNAIFNLRLKHLEIDCCWFIDEDTRSNLLEQKNETIEKFVFRRFKDDEIEMNRNEEDIQRRAKKRKR